MSPDGLTELVGVYHADGSLLGELRYVVGRARGTAHCALCDITHGAVRRKRSWDEYVAGLDLPLRLVHLDELSDDVARAVERWGSPVLLGRTAEGELVPVLDRDRLEALGGDVDAFADAVEVARALR